MSTVSMSGSDVIIIKERVFNDLADGDSVQLVFPAEIVTMKVGKNGNAVYAFNEAGRTIDVLMRIVRGSPDDKFLNNLFAQMKANFSRFPLMIGEFIKKIGDGSGNISSDTYIVSGGIFSKEVDAKTNSEGDTEQSISIYTLKFSNSPRVIS